MKTLFRAAVFAAIISGMLASKAQSQSSDGRPVVEPKSELQRLQWSLESQKKQIDQSGAAAARFTAWFKQEDKRIDAEKATLRAAEQRASNARSAWNNRVNPTW